MASDKWALCNSPQNCCGPLVNPLGGRKQPEGVYRTEIQRERLTLSCSTSCSSCAVRALLSMDCSCKPPAVAGGGAMSCLVACQSVHESAHESQSPYGWFTKGRRLEGEGRGAEPLYGWNDRGEVLLKGLQYIATQCACVRACYVDTAPSFGKQLLRSLCKQ